MIWLERSGLTFLLCAGLTCFCPLSSSPDCVQPVCPYLCPLPRPPHLRGFPPPSTLHHVHNPMVSAPQRWPGLLLHSHHARHSSPCDMLCSEQPSHVTQGFCDFTQVISLTPESLTVSGDSSWKCTGTDLISP